MDESQAESVSHAKRKLVSPPTVLLCVFLLFMNVVMAAYAGMRYPAQPSLRSARLFEYVVTWLLIGLWLNYDSKVRHAGFIESLWPWYYLIWPFIMPYHLWKTRGMRGLLPVASFILIFLLTIFVGGVVYTLYIF